MKICTNWRTAGAEVLWSSQASICPRHSCLSLHLEAAESNQACVLLKTPSLKWRHTVWSPSPHLLLSQNQPAVDHSSLQLVALRKGQEQEEQELWEMVAYWLCVMLVWSPVKLFGNISAFKRTPYLLCLDSDNIQLFTEVELMYNTTKLQVHNTAMHNF